MGILLRRISCGWNILLTKHDNASQFDEINYSWTGLCAVLSRLAQLAGDPVDLPHWQRRARIPDPICTLLPETTELRLSNWSLLRNVRGSWMKTHGVRSEHSGWLPLGDENTLGGCACSFEVRHQQRGPFIAHFQTPAMMIILWHKY